MGILKKNKFINWFVKKPKTAGFLAFLLLSFITILMVSQQYQLIVKEEQREMNTILHVIHQNIEQTIKNSYGTTLTLALTINDKGVPENFEQIGKKLLEANTGISAVQLVPDGIIKYVYPLKGNENALNLNLFSSPHLRKEALKSIETKKMYFAGPLQLKQGGIGIVGRLPVYRNNKFWGFSAVIIKLENLLKSSGINNIDSSKYYFQFSKKDSETSKEVYYLPVKKPFSKENDLSIYIPDGDWSIHLIALHPISLYYPILLLGIMGLIIATLFGFLIYIFLKIPEELNYLVNKQTQKLLDSEMIFEAIFDQAAVGIAHIDSYSGNFIETNQKFCQMLGYSPYEIKSENITTITHPDDLTEDLQDLEKLKEGKIREYSSEKRYFTKSGNYIWVNINVSPLWKTNEKATTHIAIIEDITVKKNAEELILKTETRFKSLFEDSPLPLSEEDFSETKNYLAELDLIGENKKTVYNYLKLHPEVIDKSVSFIKIINVNNACLKLYKVKTKEEILQNQFKIIDSNSKEEIIQHLIAITQGEKQFVLESKIINSEGEIRNIDLRWNVIRGYKKSFERIIVSREDSTERKATEKVILNTKQRLESLINTIDGIVWECEIENFSFNFISEKVIDILGYTPEEWIANATFWSDHIHPDDKEWAINYCVSKTNEKLNHDFEYRMIAKNGTIVWLRDIVNVVFEDEEATSLRGIMIDITKTKEAEKELNDSFQLVTEQNKRLLNFSYIVSHNLRSHTSNITSIMDLIESSDTEEEKDEMVQLLKSVSCSLNETMTHLNEVINIQTNVDLVSEPLNIRQYIEIVQSQLLKQITTKDVSFAIDIPNDIKINYNPAYLESILYNLISNAIRYKHPDRKPLISIKWFSENDSNVLQFSDNGIGIDLVRNADKIFGMYKTFSNNPESKGIGLFITKNQIDAMGGTITVESEPNLGTTFKIHIR
jgi:PAS domain S-box-containing protein